MLWQLRYLRRDATQLSHARAAAPEPLSPHARGDIEWGAATPAPLELKLDLWQQTCVGKEQGGKSSLERY